MSNCIDTKIQRTIDQCDAKDHLGNCLFVFKQTKHSHSMTARFLNAIYEMNLPMKTTCAQLKCVYSSWSIKINVAFKREKKTPKNIALRLFAFIFRMQWPNLANKQTNERNKTDIGQMLSLFCERNGWEIKCGWNKQESVNGRLRLLPGCNLATKHHKFKQYTQIISIWIIFSAFFLDIHRWVGQNNRILRRFFLLKFNRIFLFNVPNKISTMFLIINIIAKMKHNFKWK